jgi:hypothetical protein
MFRRHERCSAVRTSTLIAVIETDDSRAASRCDVKNSFIEKEFMAPHRLAALQARNVTELPFF